VRRFDQYHARHAAADTEHRRYPHHPLPTYLHTPSSYNVISELCITSVWEGGAVDPNWVLSQCPPLPGSYEDIRSWKNTTGVSGF
jgi:hypothetical protein